MQGVKKKRQKIVKGTSSAVLLSILIHVGLFLIAGMLVVFTVTRKPEKVFEPPKAVERPKMKLKKPKVNLKKTAQPRSTTRIVVTRKNRTSMPDMQLPEMSGLGDDLGGGIGGGFDLMPDIGDMTIFGGGQTIGNDFVGTLYDFKRTRTGGPTGIEPNGFLFELAKFTKSDWKEYRLARYYRSPNKLYTTHFMIPTVASDVAPTAFGEPDMMGYAWAVLYKGQIVHPTGGTFRFWAQGDDVIIVRLAGRIVVDGSVSDAGSGSFRQILTGYINTTADSMKYYMGERRAEVGKWFTLEAGVPLDMEVVIGESPGGSFAAMLAIQEEGVEYPKSPQGGPLLPMFKTAEPTHEVLDSIYEHLVSGEVDCTNGPVFCDYVSDGSKKGKADTVEVPEPAPEPAAPQAVEPEKNEIRVWSTADGKTLEGEYVCIIGDKVVLRTATGKEVKVPRAQLSPEQIEYIDFLNPPIFDIDFRAKSKQRIISTRNAVSRVPSVLQWTFGAKLRQTSVRAYDHELNVAYYAIGQQIVDGEKYILLDRGNSSFTPTRENARSHSFLSDRTVELMTFVADGQSRGRKVSGNLVVVMDKRGEVIQYKASNEWLWKNYDKLKNLPVGAFMDNSCNRVYPTGPKATRY